MTRHRPVMRGALLAFFSLLVTVYIGLLLRPVPSAQGWQTANPPSTWQDGDVFVGASDGHYYVYDGSGNYKDTLYDGLDTREVTGCAFDSTGDLYTTNFWAEKVVKYDGNDPQHPVILPYINTTGSRPESIVFDASGNFFVGEASGEKAILKFNSAGILQHAFHPAVGNSGSDWIELASDQHTMYYASEDSIIRRYDVSGNGAQGSNFTINGLQLRALKIIPPGDSVFLIASNVLNNVGFNSGSGVSRTYDETGEDNWHTLALNPLGTAFWAGGYSTGKLYRFNVLSGQREIGPITIPGNARISGICVKGEYRVAVPTPTATLTRTPTSTPSPTSTPTTEPQPPLYTTSYYIQENSPLAARQLGCAARARGEQGVVVLDFGAPIVLPSGSYGTLLPRAGEQVSLNEIHSMVMEFAQGYDTPSLCLYSPPFVPRDLAIVVGVSNSALFANDIWHDNQNLTYAHGVAWANMMNDLHSKFVTYDFAPNIRVLGGIDAEFYGAPFADCRNPSTGRRGPCPNPNPQQDAPADQWTVYSVEGSTEIGTKHWVEGYNNQQGNTGKLLLFNFGSCEDCGRTGDPTTWNPTEIEAFRRVFHLTWELAMAVPNPQVYHEPYPYEWYNVRWYAYSVRNRLMSLFGALTQCGSAGCLDNNPSYRLQPRFDIACHPQTPCTGDWTIYNCAFDPCPNFPPSPGWQAILDMVSSPNTPEGTPNPTLPRQFFLSYGVSDIQCQVPTLCD